MRVDPNTEDIGRKKQHSKKRDITGDDDCNKIEYKIKREHLFLTHQMIQLGFIRPVNPVFFAVIKTIDNITAGDHYRGRNHNKKEINIKQYFSKR